MEMVNKVVKTVCPPAEVLSVIVNNVKCEECGLSFRNEPRLRMHVLKIHRRKNLEKTVKENVRYHCPEISCVYSSKSQRYFKEMKYLKQHYLKVHAAKTFACTMLQCAKSFSTEAARQAHLRVCGVRFSCSRCLRKFGTYEALLTHAKRTSHSVDEKYKSALARKRSKTTSPVARTTVRREHRPVFILPRCYDIRNKVGFSDAAVQTDDIIKQRRKRMLGVPSEMHKRLESRQTQTNALSKEKKQRKTVGTQTSHVACGSLDSHKINFARLQKAKNTFTKADLVFNDNSASEHLFPNSPLQLEHDVGLHYCFWEEKNTSLGTQTSPEKDLLEAFNESVTQTELVSLYSRQQSSCLDLRPKNIGKRTSCLAYAGATNLNADAGSYSFDTTATIAAAATAITTTTTTTTSNNDISSCTITRSDPMLTVQIVPDKFTSIETQTETAYSSTHATFFNSDVALSRSFALSSNTETQTTENFPNIEQLLYSNTCTQTCNDILPPDLGLSDIQTQTVWPELEDSTVSACASTATSLFTSTETQTRDVSSRITPCTNISSCRSWFLNNRTSHTETQTDLLSIFDEFQ